MNEQQFQALVEYIDARIDEKLYGWDGRDSLNETLRTDACRVELREAFGLSPI